jgi:hypothetical protein
MCEEKQRLLEAYQTSEAAYSERLTALSRLAGTLSLDDYTVLKVTVDSARLASECARIAFDVHVGTHLC